VEYPAAPGPPARDAIVLLLAMAWPRLPTAIRRARQWGVDWFALSRPFVRTVTGRGGDGPVDEPVAHVGVMELPLRVGGGDVTIAGIHAVCTHPAYRGKGHMRAAMAEALAYVDARWRAAALWTSRPAVFERFGFKIVREHVFRAPLDVPFESRAATTVAVGAREDMVRFARLLEKRRPVSNALGALDRGPIALVGLSQESPPSARIDYVDALGCAIVFEVADRTLRVFDVVGESVPPVAEIAARIGACVDDVELYVSPDLLAVPRAVAAPHPMKDVLMVRGAIFDGAPPFALSPLTRC
jgi:GNAT superfamily N-acetyltransferase